MEWTRKQKILLGVLIGGAVLLAAVLGLWIALSAANEPAPTEPPLNSASPETPPETTEPSPTPTALPTPSSTPYRLPLVPEGEATSPPISQTVAAQAEPTAAVRIRSEAKEGVYTSTRKEFLAIGTQNGEAVAVLLVRLQPPNATVLAIPCETLAPVYTLGENCTLLGVETARLAAATARAQSVKEGCWNLIWAIKNLIGYQAPEYLCVDFACMEAFFAFAPCLETETGTITLGTFRQALAETGQTRAQQMGALGVGAAQYLLRVSLWELPGFKSATRDAFSSSLSVLELFSLLRTLRGIQDFSLSVLPVEKQDGAWVYTKEDVPF